ncbi:hypothetical protein SS05631_b56090 (plasmid) [Sinorhizobium sp. CCBAU 05631]|nr:hypothetical protein SS05631_b56090 [Sinorhizobium sp. CCBAU 05631]
MPRSKAGGRAACASTQTIPARQSASLKASAPMRCAARSPTTPICCDAPSRDEAGPARNFRRVDTPTRK